MIRIGICGQCRRGFVAFSRRRHLLDSKPVCPTCVRAALGRGYVAVIEPEGNRVVYVRPRLAVRGRPDFRVHPWRADDGDSGSQEYGRSVPRRPAGGGIFIPPGPIIV